MTPDSAQAISKQTSTTFSGVSMLGWIVAIAVVVVLYNQFPKLRGMLSGVLILVAIGIALRYQSNVTGTFHQLFFTKG